MAPPGRRRASSPLISLFLFTFLLFSPVALAQIAVLGIDLGTEYIKAALVKPGIPLEIVLTKDSKRKETSAVAFKASGAVDIENKQYPERLYGGDALALAPRIPGDVYPNLKHILGGLSTPFGEAAVEAYKQRYPGLNLGQGGGQDGLGFHSSISGLSDDQFSVEELLGMVLKGIRMNSQTMAGKGSKIRDSVITIPAFYTADERTAIVSAAELAGLKVVGLISDGLAVGINYATSRTFADPLKGGKAEHHLVFDMGAGSTTATVLRFQAKTVKDVGRFNKTIQEVSVLGTGWDRSLGGDALNDLIVNDMVEQFVQSKGAKSLSIDASTVKKHGRAMAKLTRDAERARQVLSANAETSAFFEGLYEDVDFRYKISRSTFESLAADFADRVGAPINEAIAKAGLSMADIDSVILYGGAVRTPFVQSSLEALVGDSAKLKTNVNADEAAVFGAAFKAAGLSKNFKVKEIKDRDAASYSATVQWTSNGKERKQTIFQPTSNSGTAKQMPFKMVEDFEFSIVQNIPGLASDDKLTQAIATVQVANLTATVQELVDKYNCVRNNISTLLTFHLDPASGLPAVVKGTASCESEVSEKPAEGIIDNVKGLFGFGKKDQKPLTEDEDGDIEEEILPDIESPTSVSATTSSSASATTSGAAADASKAVAGDKLHIINLEIISTSAGIGKPDAAALKAIKARLSAFDASDRARAKRSETFNTLESLTYRVRDLLTDTAFQGVTSESQRSAIENTLSTTCEWLSSAGADATYDAIKEKLNSLQGLVEPVKTRIDESFKRPASLKALQEALNSTETIAEMIRDQIDRAAHAAKEAAASATESPTEVFESVTSVAADAAESVTSKVADAISSVTSSIGDAASSASSIVLDSTSTSTPLNDLDDFDTSSSSSSTSTSSTRTPKPTPSSLTSFTEADYTSLTSLRDTISSWLSESEAAQSSLSAHDDPAYTVADIERKAKELSDKTAEMMRKMLKGGGSKFNFGGGAGGGFGGKGGADGDGGSGELPEGFEIDFDSPDFLVAKEKARLKAKYGGGSDTTTKKSTKSKSSKTKKAAKSSSTSAGGFRIPTPKVSIHTPAAASGTAPPDPVAEAEIRPDGGGLDGVEAPEPQVADIVLEDEMAGGVPVAESTTEPRVSGHVADEL